MAEKNRKVLITGGSGLLGSNLVYEFRGKYTTFFTFNKHPIRVDKCKAINIDLIDSKKILEKILEINPQVIIHCAALTNVDYCEEHPEEARLINYEVTNNIAKIAKKLGSYLVYISTDSVFDGKKGDYKENDAPNPINVYGRTKLMGEEAIRKIHDNYLIIRTNIYGWNAVNKFSLAEWILDRLEKRLEFPGFKDIFFTPILVNNFGRAILEMCEKNIVGLYNIAGSEKCSKLGFAYKIAEIFNLDNSLIKPTDSSVANLKAKRGKNMDLNTEKVQGILKTDLLNVRRGLETFRILRENGFVDILKNKN